MEIDPSLAYPLSDIDPHIDVEINEERRLELLKPVLRAFAKSVGNASLVDPDSDASFGSLLASQAKAELGKPIVESIFGMNGKKCKAARWAGPTCRTRARRPFRREKTQCTCCCL